MKVLEFAERRFELPEGGRWYELHAGQPVLLEAPNDKHGNVVLNLSRAFAIWLQQSGASFRGYACHELGLHVEQDPDSVYVPAISFFDQGPLFSQTDLIVASQVPRVVVDVASAADRRREMERRIHAYLKLGVQVVWIPDPLKNEIQVVRHDQSMNISLDEHQILEEHQWLPGFQIEVRRIFEQPSWWTGPSVSK